jgi:hypothetical protein
MSALGRAACRIQSFRRGLVGPEIGKTPRTYSDNISQKPVAYRGSRRRLSQKIVRGSRNIWP